MKSFLKLLKQKIVVFRDSENSNFLFTVSRKIRLMVLLVSLFLFISCFPNEEKHKKDNEMIENFTQHKEQFDQILQIMRENCDVSQNPANKVKLNDEKLAEYKKLSKEIGFSDEVFGNCVKDGVEFVDSVQGLAVSGSAKGYAFLVNKPETVADNLNTYSHPNFDSYTVYRNIEGNWYLFFEFNN